MRTGHVAVVRPPTTAVVRRLFVVVAAVAALLPAVDAANVLAFVPMPLKSHFAGFLPVFEELARRGHNVTVVSAFPSAGSGYTDVDVSLPDFPGTYLYTRCTSPCMGGGGQGPGPSSREV